MSDTQICHINVARGFRGGERQTELQIRELAKRRVSQAPICRRSQPLVSRLADIFSASSGLPFSESTVHDNHNGLLIDPGRPDQFLAAIVRLYEDPELRHEFGDVGARIAAANTPAAMCAKYLEINAAVLGRALGAPGVAS